MKKQDQEFTPQSPWLDLVNSEFRDGFGQTTDYLRDDRWLVSSLLRWGLSSELLKRESAAAELVEIRSLVRRWTERLASGRSLSNGDIRTLNALLAVPSYRQLLRGKKGLAVELRPVTVDWKWVRARIAGSFLADWLERPQRIKVCRNPECRWAFVDTTKGNVRRWCKDSLCSNRDRARRARQRARTG
jgi:predicted RNA-binding Zn ribbon-like protein